MVKVREVKHSDDDVSSGSDSQGEEGEFDNEEDMLIGGSEAEDMMMDDDESGESDLEGINPASFFEDECEEGEVDMDDYGEEGEMEMM
jgi:hypothetical protein